MSFFSKLTKEFEGLQSNFSKEKDKDDGAAQRGYGTFEPQIPKLQLLDVREGAAEVQHRPTTSSPALVSFAQPPPTPDSRLARSEEGKRPRNR